MDIGGRIALVRGASGIGKAMVEIMLQKQAKAVFIVDINEDGLNQTKKEFDKTFGEGRVHTYKCDVSSRQQMEECFKNVMSRYGELHIVCNNAGFCDEINWEKSLSVNLLGVIIGSKLAVQHMGGEETGGGVIINVSSIDGLSLHPGAPIYATSKYGVIGFTRQIAAYDSSVAKKKIRVNVICPNGAVTPFLTNFKVEKEYEAPIQKLVEEDTWAMKPQDLAQHFARLIEEPHHGETLFVDSAQKTEFIADETAAFREKWQLTEPFLQLRDAVLK